MLPKHELNVTIPCRIPTRLIEISGLDFDGPRYSVDWAEISANTRSTSRPTLVGRYSSNTIGLHLGRDVGRYLGRYSTDTMGRHSTDIAADIRPTFRTTFGQDIDRHLVERRSTCSSSWYTVSGHYTTTTGSRGVKLYARIILCTSYHIKYITVI